ncbi:hypothetical protein BO82DRAFT_20504 [Aspergillus uvarum CBS 121591]|uniref:Uncharacterized protein n=1 Tax=Aspergillus uvarum CBS 121591 TaxID=1448315 RepID=A0A319CJG6_9EURO|nr:hypothetical protein BO82DRAFT_20504 [Aspergillus uvarum CBS 121591]PYH75568.1 hypothetical protein BO82DRAFT_20504 [Aspergillus uvarum CBS 121591]
MTDSPLASPPVTRSVMNPSCSSFYSLSWMPSTLVMSNYITSSASPLYFSISTSYICIQPINSYLLPAI